MTFTESKPLRSCMTGEPTVLPITVTGQAPLKLTYAVQLGDEQRAFLVGAHTLNTHAHTASCRDERARS